MAEIVGHKDPVIQGVSYVARRKAGIGGSLPGGGFYVYEKY